MPRIEPIPHQGLKPEQRAMVEGGIASGAFCIAPPLPILAYADRDQLPDDGDRHPNFPMNLLGGELLELAREGRP